MFLHYVRLGVWVNVAGLVKMLNSASRSWIFEKSLCKQKKNLLSYVKTQVEAGLMKYFMVQVKSGSMKIDIVIGSGIDGKQSVNCCSFDINLDWYKFLW